MSDEIRYCAYCDQQVDLIPDSKTITAAEAPGKYKHRKTSDKGVPYCGRQFLDESETYTES